MTKKVHILQEKLNEETVVLGIASSDSLFKLILEINKHTNLDLKAASPVYNPSKNETITFPHGIFYNEDAHVHLIKNKNNGFVLFYNAKIFDFLLIYIGENARQTADILTGLIKKNINSISVIAEIDSKKLKNLKNTLTSNQQ